MEKNNVAITKSTHPGAVIKMELKARGMKQKELAAQIGIHPSHLSEMIKGVRNVNDQTAEAIAKVLNIPAAHLIQLQTKYTYEMKLASKDNPEEYQAQGIINQYDEQCDVRKLLKYAGITGGSSATQLAWLQSEMFVGIQPQKLPEYFRGYYHRSAKTGLDTRMINTWTLMAQYELRRKKAPSTTYSKDMMDRLAAELATIFHENSNTLNRMEHTLEQYGIKFCIVPKVERASIDGYSFVKDGQPGIAVTKRYDRIDNLAFAVLHEVGHLKMHLSDNEGRINLCSNEENLSNEEHDANKFAIEALIPNSVWESAPVAPMVPHIIQRRYTTWAKTRGYNQWVVLGRIAHETGMYMFKSDEDRMIK